MDVLREIWRCTSSQRMTKRVNKIRKAKRWMKFQKKSRLGWNCRDEEVFRNEWSSTKKARRTDGESRADGWMLMKILVRWTLFLFLFWKRVRIKWQPNTDWMTGGTNGWLRADDGWWGESRNTSPRDSNRLNEQWKHIWSNSLEFSVICKKRGNCFPNTVNLCLAEKFRTHGMMFSSSEP